MLDESTAAAYRAACCGAAVLSFTAEEAGSRRRRLWELQSAAHCPVLGVCLPIAVLRRLVDKAAPTLVCSNDYELHCVAVSGCKRRAALCEAMHKELERRYALAVRQAAAAKCSTTLGAWWRTVRGDERMPGALWAVLTHARCDAVLEHLVLGEVHMLQHQRGAAQRVDAARFDAAVDDNAQLRAELDTLRQRVQQQAAELAVQVERVQTQAMRFRAEAIGRDTAMAALRDELQMLEAQVPGLKSRAELSRQAAAQAERITDLERALMRAQLEVDRDRRRADEALADKAPPSDDTAPPLLALAPPPTLGDRAVLCVGGRPASVPLYRHIVERSGGRFLHHDGGEEQSAQRLDATLSAADLVICQTGCISHDAYWRVKDYCKRHGKPCVFVENPGSASLKRALVELQS
jgi:hypothetical protein